MARLARLGALVAVVGLTALPFASCSGVDFLGHEILRNEPPDPDRVTKDALGSAFPGIEDADVPRRTADRMPKSGRLFDGDDRWLHGLYVGLFVLAVLALALPARAATHAALAVLGIGGTVLFLETFERRLASGGGDAGPVFLRPDLRWEAGAYVTLGGFGLVLVAALTTPRAPASRRGTSRGGRSHSADAGLR